MGKNELLSVGQRRRIRVEECMLTKCTVQEIATLLGQPIGTILTDVDVIYKQWAESDRTLKDKRLLVIRCLEFCANRAMIAFEKSKQNAEEISTVSMPRDCPDCKGQGKVADTDKWCETCGGDGKLPAETVTRRSRGQAGDASFLHEYRECQKEIARLQGLIRPNRGKKKRDEMVLGQIHTHVHAHLSGQIDWSKVPSELLLEAMEIHERAKQLGMQQAIDVEVAPSEPSGTDP